MTSPAVPRESTASPPPGRVRVVGSTLRRHPFRLATALCVAGIASVAAIVPSWTVQQIELSLGPRPPHFSELFFTNLAGLPRRIPPGQHASVPFAIVNREGRAFRYSYTVSVTEPTGHLLVTEQKQVTLQNNQKATWFAPFSVGGKQARYTVMIKIARPLEYIEFHGETR